MNCLTGSFTYQLPAFPGGLLQIGWHKYPTVLGALGHCDVQLRVMDGGSNACILGDCSQHHIGSLGLDLVFGLYGNMFS